MVFIPDEIEQTLEALQKIPGFGERGASRFFYSLLKLPLEERMEIVKHLAKAVKSLKPCKECGIYTPKEVCDICSSPERSKKLITVVEESSDAYSIERLGKYKGVYHILGGHIAPLEGIGPQELNIEKLMERVEKYQPLEVILATNPNTEGEATASYLARLLKTRFPTLKVTRIGFGAAFGTYLELLEDFQIENLLKEKREY